MATTAVEKIFRRASGDGRARTGDAVTVRPDRIMAYNFPGYVDELIRAMQEDFGVTVPDDPDQYVVFVDHLDTKGTEAERALHDVTREWAARTGVNFYEDAGIGHQAAAELGFAAPGSLVVHFDPHVSNLGALGCLGIGLNRQILDPWVTGRIELTVPPSVRVDLSGTLAPGVDGRDLVHHLIAAHGADGFLESVVEFAGPGVSALSIGERQAVCGMVSFTGALTALMELDDASRDYARQVVRSSFVETVSDPGAEFAQRISVDLGNVRPMVVLPGSAKADHSVVVSDLEPTRVTRGYIGSCANGRIEDLRMAARLLDGNRVHDGFDLLIVPTSTRIGEQAREEGLLDILECAGARIGKSSCDFCFGYASPSRDEDVAISTGTLNVRGRLGNPRSPIYLASAATVAASSLSGWVTDPRTTEVVRGEVLA